MSKFTFTVQPIDEYGRIGFEDRAPMEGNTFATFEAAVRQLASEGHTALDVTVLIEQDIIESTATEEE